PLHPRCLHAFPTRRSSDLVRLAEPVGQHPVELEVRLRVATQESEELALRYDRRFDRAGGDHRARAGVLVDGGQFADEVAPRADRDRKSTRLNSSHVKISYA